MYTAAYVWAKVLSRLEQRLSDVAVSAWFDDADIIQFTKEKMILYSPSEFRKSIIQKQCTQYIEDAVKELFDMAVKLEVWGEKELQEYREGKLGDGQSDIPPQFTFAGFVEGESNRFAKQITMMAAENPGLEICNPLFLYGVPGVGKTHLLYAAANYIRQNRPELKLIFIKAEAFTNELVRAIQQGSTAVFRNKYRQADVLLLDDIQFIAGKEATQEEFFHTFNALFESNRQIILTADRKPADMATLADRLRDRFGEGVMVEINPPDQRTRLEIVYQKAKKFGLRIDAQSASYISDTTQSVRQIEGILKKLWACRELTGVMPTPEMVVQTIEKLVSAPSRTITPALILQQVSKYYGVEEQILIGPQRNRNVALPRQMAMYLMRQLTKLSFEEIAKLFGRERTTVMYAVQKLAQMENSLKSDLEEIRANIEMCL